VPSRRIKQVDGCADEKVDVTPKGASLPASNVDSINEISLIILNQKASVIPKMSCKKVDHGVVDTSEWIS